MAEQLGSVAYKLLTEKADPSANARRRRSRVNKINELKTAIEDLHRYLEDAENRRQNDRDHVTFNNVLADAEKRCQNDENVKNWLDRVKDVYYDVIDVCEELRTEEMKVQEGRKGQALPYPNPLGQCALKIRDGVVKMTDKISQAVKDLSKTKIGELNLNPMARVLLGKPTVELVNDNKAQIYGRDGERRSIIPRMYHTREHVQVISILGETGIGKTAVAQLVYDEAKAKFDLPVWVNVSDEFSSLRIARDFVERVTSKKINKIELGNPIQRVREIIRGKRYLLVLDGVQVEKEFDTKWENLMTVFNCGGPGCTILMTTRQETNVPKVSTYKKRLATLSGEDCWSIIQDEAFGTPSTGVKVDRQTLYEEVGEKLVEKCKGLPIIAKTLGGVLRGRTSLDDWKRVLRSDIWESGPTDKPHAMKATMLSYYFLPPELRHCLLYCSIFPKSHYIDVNKLINLWMAQDSIGLGQETMEEDGWNRFKDLLDHRIFQEFFQQDDSGNFKCRLQGAMSDLLHDLAKNECHIMPLDMPESEGKQVPELVRHCTLNVPSQASLPASISKISEKLHTLMLLSEYSLVDPTNLSTLLSQMGRLRALDLSYCSMRELPSKACELLHLRYLDLSFNRDLKNLPQAICNLLNLQTLNLDGCDDLRELPKGIGKLTKLRHLDILWTTNLSYLPKGLTSLTSLRRLTRFFGSSGVDNKACNLADLQHLNKLQGYITLEGLGDENSASEAETAGLNNKKDLLGLELWFSVVGSKSNDERILEALQPQSGLQCLGIFYYKGSFSSSLPSWITKLDKLRHLVIADCSNCDTLPPLGKLESLESLEIKNLASVKKVGPEFVGSREDSSQSKLPFPKLQKLHFEMLDNWVAWEGTNDFRVPMPSLSFLSIVGCPNMRDLPNYIKGREKLEIVTNNGTQ